ncbi:MULTISPECIES: hypothetical protein [Halorussus]|uniref:hypothetical protein n=1 Tax=Halorussus TaxID=1070314 RepID=UPI0013B37C05|nr:MULTISPECIES: hypothetical protein [Halorussus]NHN58558.1 hypothetical protein [Halorussus sp. JP-T4]
MFYYSWCHKMTRKMIVIAVACTLLVSIASGGTFISLKKGGGQGLQSEETNVQSEPLSFNVSSINAENTTVGGLTTVTAEITNPNSVNLTQNVTLRAGIESEVVERIQVSISADNSTTVQFHVFISEQLVAQSGMEAGRWNFFTVQTRQHGSPAWFYLRNQSAES